MKPIIIAVLTFSLLLTGCWNTPIKTILDVPSLGKYVSEKDVKVIKRSFDPETGNLTEELEVQAVASAPAMVQAEREKAQAEVNAKSLDLATQIISGSVKP